MNNQILKIISSLKGSLLGIGLEEDILLDAIENNENIQTCYLLTPKNSNNKKFNLTKRGRNKKINIKKVRKHFKKKSLNNIICNYKAIKQFQKSFIPNSVYLNNRDLYIYGSKEDIKLLKQKYQRYTKNIEIIHTDEGNILKVNNKNTKTNFFKDTFYKIKDTTSEILDILTDLLIN